MSPPAALFSSLEPKTAPTEARGYEGLVLLVEDEDSLAELLTCLMGRLRVRVLRAADGAQARQLFRQHRADLTLAFVDCNLPDAQGADLCVEMRAVVPNLPLLITSGRDQRGLTALLAAGGPCDFLPKPYMPQDVLQRVRALLGATA